MHRVGRMTRLFVVPGGLREFSCQITIAFKVTNGPNRQKAATFPRPLPLRLSSFPPLLSRALFFFFTLSLSLFTSKSSDVGEKERGVARLATSLPVLDAVNQFQVPENEQKISFCRS